MMPHGNARLSPKGGLLLCGRVFQEGWSLATAAEAAGVSERTASRWVGRYRAEGEAGLVESNRPGIIGNHPDDAASLQALGGRGTRGGG
jgi:hypothetical protein